jgi:hypothetical protein
MPRLCAVLPRSAAPWRLLLAIGVALATSSCGLLGAIVNLTTPAAPLTASYSTGGAPGSVSFFSVVSGPAPTGTNTANSETDTLLSALLAGRAYANIHTTAHTSGEIRGQYALVPTIPEPETYALMLAGLGIVGWVVSRRHKVGV